MSDAAPTDPAVEVRAAMEEVKELTELESRLTDNAVAPLDPTTELVEQNVESELEHVPEPEPLASSQAETAQNNVDLPLEPDNWAPRDAAEVEKHLSEEVSAGEDEDAEGEMDELASEDEQMPLVTPAGAYDEPEDVKPNDESVTADEPPPDTSASSHDQADLASTQGMPDEQTRRSASPVRRPRRPPGQQRRSPSYNLDAPPPANVPPPRAARASFSRPSQSSFDFEGLEFPEGLSASSVSVRKHASLVEAWKEATTALDLGRESQALHSLFRAAAEDGDVDDARSWFDHFFKLNPTATIPLSQMIDLELSHGNLVQVVGLYERALRGAGGVTGVVPGVDIWSEMSSMYAMRRNLTLPPRILLALHQAPKSDPTARRNQRRLRGYRSRHDPKGVRACLGSLRTRH